MNTSLAIAFIASIVLGGFMTVRGRLKRYPLATLARWAGIGTIAAFFGRDVQHLKLHTG
jgi:hypothetical protein